MYPPDWPRCHCGDHALDGHLTCGRVECDESGSRSRATENPERRQETDEEEGPWNQLLN
jgi:hypothetical protein